MPANILELRDNFDLFLLDMYGVVWDGAKPASNALYHMEMLRRAGKCVVILSNDARPSALLDEKYAERGFVKGFHYDEAVTSGDLAQMVFSHDERPLKYYVIGRPTKEVFESSPYLQTENIEAANFIYLGSPKILTEGEFQNVESVNPFAPELQHAASLGKKLICPNPDLKAPTPSGRLAIRQGSLAAYYKTLGGEVLYFGKPQPEIYEFVLQHYDVPRERILMVGDTLYTDILGAKNCAIASALVTTGISAAEMECVGVNNIEEYCHSQKIVPDFILPSF